MTTQADYTAGEWDLILQAPALASLFIIQSGSYNRIAVARKLFAALAVITETAPHGPDTELIQAVSAAMRAGQAPRQPIAHPHDLAAARHWVLEHCRALAALLAQKVPEAEAEAFTRWLIRIGQRVALADDLIGQPMSRVAEAQMRTSLALEMLTAALTIPFGVRAGISVDRCA
ncbi:MAG: hypothetical protein WCI67_14595 [Chloroflexales bacterium]